MRRWKLIATALLSMILSPHFVCATDIPVTPTGPVFTVPSLIWGQSGPNGVNNNFFFTPLSLNENVCVYIYNNNPTNTHTVNLNIIVTGNPTAKPSDGTWTGI